MTALPEYRVADVDLARLDAERLRALQDERLRTMVAYAYETSAFWQGKLDAAGVAPSDVAGVADVGHLPLTDRDELHADQDAHPPFGSYACSPREAWARLFTTSGTSGRRLRRIFSSRDWGYAVDRLAHGGRVSPGDVCLVLGPTDGLMGPTASVEAWQRAGALPVLAGAWDTEAKARAIRELRPAVVSGTASYLLHLSEIADLTGCGVRLVQSVGEPGAAVDATRALLAERFGGAAVGDGYGLTELMPLGGSCPVSRSLHVAADLVLMECLDPATAAPVAPGELGELVYTNLVGDTQPLLRYRSRDLARLSDASPCGCGVRAPRIERIEGRADEMIWYRGVNVFPSAIEGVVRGHASLSPEYRVIIDALGALPTLTVQVERIAEDAGALAGDVAARLRSAIGVRAEVEVLDAGSLPRAEAGTKACRVLDRRAG